MTIMSFIRMR